jgi:hypothetical protein
MTAPIGFGGGVAQNSAEQASPHRGSGLGPAHGGGKTSGRAIVIGGGKQRSVGAALTGESRGGVGGGREHRHRWPVKGNNSKNAQRAYPLATAEVAA